MVIHEILTTTSSERREYVPAFRLQVSGSGSGSGFGFGVLSFSTHPSLESIAVLLYYFFPSIFLSPFGRPS